MKEFDFSLFTDRQLELMARQVELEIVDQAPLGRTDTEPVRVALETYFIFEGRGL